MAPFMCSQQCQHNSARMITMERLLFRGVCDDCQTNRLVKQQEVAHLCYCTTYWIDCLLLNRTAITTTAVIVAFSPLMIMLPFCFHWLPPLSWGWESISVWCCCWRCHCWRKHTTTTSRGKHWTTTIQISCDSHSSQLFAGYAYLDICNHHVYGSPCVHFKFIYECDTILS